MDERDNIFSVSGEASDNKEKSEQKYIPKHEKPSEEPVQQTAPPPQQAAPPPQSPPRTANSQPRRPVYDSFMYEPIGFDEYDRMTAAETKAAEEKRERNERRKRERTLILLFVLILIIAASLAAYGIISDVIRARNGGVITSDGKPVLILYQSQKPEGANELANMKD